MFEHEQQIGALLDKISKLKENHAFAIVSLENSHSELKEGYKIKMDETSKLHSKLIAKLARTESYYDERQLEFVEAHIGDHQVEWDVETMETIFTIDLILVNTQNREQNRIELTNKVPFLWEDLPKVPASKGLFLAEEKLLEEKELPIQPNHAPILPITMYQWLQSSFKNFPWTLLWVMAIVGLLPVTLASSDKLEENKLISVSNQNNAFGLINFPFISLDQLERYIVNLFWGNLVLNTAIIAGFTFGKNLLVRNIGIIGLILTLGFLGKLSGETCFNLGCRTS